MDLLTYITNGLFSEEIQTNNIFRLPVSLDMKQKNKVSNIQIKTKIGLSISNKQIYRLNLKRKDYNIKFKNSSIEAILKIEKK